MRRVYCAGWAVWWLSWMLTAAVAQGPPIPEPLKPWQDWVTWGDQHRNCPTVFNDAERHICFWPTRLTVNADAQQATWQLDVTTFAETWVPLPGGEANWPQRVRLANEPLAVIQREGVPHVRLVAGTHQVVGEFRWDTMPEKVAIPQEIGVVSLSLLGKPVPLPNWDAQGDLWLQRVRAEVTDKDFLGVQVYRVIEDGIPVWLRSRIELTVSGKSREEDLGSILPANWTLSLVDSPLPVAIDEAGRMKVQVRAGKWTVDLHAFRTIPEGEIRFGEGAMPPVATELIGFKSNPAFRIAELEGVSSVDVTQTTFPDDWRSLPVFQWTNSAPFRIVEKLRGMGDKKPAGLTIRRRFWLDEDGRGWTYDDLVRGTAQQIWRLDVAEGQQLGAVRINGQGQLITANPQTGVAGFEVRSRNLDLQAVGRVEGQSLLPATGWRAPAGWSPESADSLQVTLTLPPGWRVFALFGADRVDGDWLTAWSLLDLFLLLIFALAVVRIWGVPAGVLAFLAFGLAYHEPGAPRLTWFFLLMPVALLRLVTKQPGMRWLRAWRFVALALLVVLLIPFLARQVQTALFPQLEVPGTNFQPRGDWWPWFPGIRAARQSEYASTSADGVFAPSAIEQNAMNAEESLRRNAQQNLKSKMVDEIMAFDPKARIQTGPARPNWSWNQVNLYWDGPVSSDETIRPLLISMQMHRVLTVVRVVLLLSLLALIAGGRQVWPLRRQAVPSSAVAMLLVTLFCLCGGTAQAQTSIPDGTLLEELRTRLLQPSDAFPNAAEIGNVQLKLEQSRISMEIEVHTAVPVAVPLPGKLPAWSPLKIQVDGQPGGTICRHEGYLWISLPGGVHRVQVEGMLPDVAEWQWTYLLPPRRVEIQAPEWQVTGVGPNGAPEGQVFFTRQQQLAPGSVAYDRKDFQPVVVVERHLEIGINWQIRNVVSRLAGSNRAVELRVPLLNGESVLSSNVTAENGVVQVRMAADEATVEWRSELQPVSELRLTSPVGAQWVERWRLAASPIWHVTHEGLAPIFETQQQALWPVWYPWPGESTLLKFTRPEAVPGDTVTIHSVIHRVALGDRQRTSELAMEVESSLGGEFPVQMDAGAEISTLTVGGQSVPVRQSDRGLLLPLQPGRQEVKVEYRTAEKLRLAARVGAVTLPEPSANVTTVVSVPESRWILWTHGPLMGPAVRFWAILAFSLLTAWVLGVVPGAHLTRWQWILLALGLTQIHVIPALIVVGWFFAMSRRGKMDVERTHAWSFNLLQVLLVIYTFVMLGILVAVVGEGLLGNPEMFIVGNSSTRSSLQWFQPRVESVLPRPEVVSISVWYYRLLMLFWALWLAAALLNWLKWAWEQFNTGGGWKKPEELVKAELSGR